MKKHFESLGLVLKSRFIKYTIFALVMLSAALPSFALEIMHNKRMQDYNKNPITCWTIPYYTDTINTVLESSPSQAPASEDEKKSVFKAMLGTALIHRTNNQPTFDANKSDHFWILDYVQRSVQALAASGSIFTNSTVLENILNNYNDSTKFTSLSEISIRTLALCFIDVYQTHQQGYSFPD